MFHFHVLSLFSLNNSLARDFTGSKVICLSVFCLYLCVPVYVHVHVCVSVIVCVCDTGNMWGSEDNAECWASDMGFPSVCYDYH